MLGAALVSCSLAAKDRVDEVADLILQSPEFSSVTLSPDGSHLAMNYYIDDQRTIGTYDLEKKKGHHLVLGAGNNVGQFGWLDADHLIYSLGKWDYFHNGIYVISEGIRNKERIDEPTRRRLFALSSTLPTVEREALLWNIVSKPFPEVYRFRYPDSFKQIVDRDEMVRSWAFDREGNFRVKQVGTENPNEYKVFHRKSDDAEWVSLDLPDLDGIHGFNYSGEILFVTHKASGHTALQAFDPVAQEFVGGAIEDPNYAVYPDLIRSPETGDLMGFSYDADRPVITYLDPGLQQVTAMLKRSLPGMVHRYVGRRGEASLLFMSWSDRQPGILHELNLKERALKRVLETRPGINAEEMAPKVPFTFPSRDGVTLRGYYTLPLGMDPEDPEPAPMIVIVHGGPRARDYWGFDSEVQFFAHLGYVVLQVNYRGSEGMYEGQEPITFLDACKYGVDDVVDGTRWMVEQGFADRDRLAIYGWSFGGYSSVACAARYPDLFKCAYAAGGVYDFVAMWEEREDRYREYLKWDTDFLGDLELQQDDYRAVSPVYEADKVQIPIYLLHGDADGVVGKTQSKLMYKALRAAGKEVELETPGWLGHGAWNETQHIRFTKDVYRFCEANFN